MSPSELVELKKLIIFCAEYYGRDLKPQVVSMMASDLQDLDFRDVADAYENHRRTSKTHVFPMPAQIRAIVQPQIDPDSASREIAARISGAIVKFGWNNSGEAKVYIGPIGWSVVERFGGWMYLCQNHGVTIDPTAFHAQAREIAKSSIKFSSGVINLAIGARDIKREPLMLEGNQDEDIGYIEAEDMDLA